MINEKYAIKDENLDWSNFNAIGFDISRTLIKDGRLGYPDTIFFIASGGSVIFLFSILKHILLMVK